MSSLANMLVIEPSHYDVSYRINPWMQPERWAHDPAGSQRAAQRAFQDLCRALREAGCHVIVGDGRAGLPDMVFPANAAIVLDGRALLARFRYAQRQGEEAAYLALFEKLVEQGWLDSVAQLPPGCYQEGAGDCIWDVHRQVFWGAYGPRSTRESLAAIEACFSRQVVPMELATQRCYHLDVCFCPLSGGEILYYPPALTGAALASLHERVPAELLIEATEDDLAHFSVNAVCVERHIVMSRTTARLRAVLRERGYQVSEVDLTPFMLSGGGAYCMTLRLDRSSAATACAHEGVDALWER